MRTLTPTRPIRARRGIEPSPRRSQRRVLPLHQKRHHSRLAATQRGARLANHTAEEEGLEPSPPNRAATFSKRVRRNRYSPLFQTILFHAPAGTRTRTSSFASSRGHPFHHGDAFVIPYFVIGHSQGHIPARTRTRNAAFEAPHDHPFQHGDSLTFWLLTTGCWLLLSPKECPYLRRPPRLEPHRRVPRLHRKAPSFLAVIGPAKNHSNKKPRRPSGLRGLLSVIGPLSSSSPGIRAPIAVKRITARNLHARLLMAGHKYRVGG